MTDNKPLDFTNPIKPKKVDSNVAGRKRPYSYKYHIELPGEKPGEWITYHKCQNASITLESYREILQKKGQEYQVKYKGVVIEHWPDSANP